MFSSKFTIKSLKAREHESMIVFLYIWKVGSMKTTEQKPDKCVRLILRRYFFQSAHCDAFSPYLFGDTARPVPG
jgi:hypothetical protein